MFGYLRYDGGAVVVHALRRELGDERFFAVMAGWVETNDGSSATTEDFVAHAEEVAGRDLDAFFDEWLFAEALPAEYPA
jgi:aminopeptidase N